ncbi:MAG: cytochrome c, partial [Alphaproteobacteria bacterium]|nr:cytochrome c [Alphaproteobacteria bacterium]
IARGKYLATLGDCAACHTADGGQPLAGGRPLETPFGPLYSTNITPDPQTGIGKYSFAQFDRALRYGMAADGHNLYPAMPYPSFARIAPEDMRDLYAYMMKGVQPVAQTNKPSGMYWPFSMRFTLTGWRKFFGNLQPFTSDPAHDAAWNRGAYIVQGLGHCGACHTPRGLAFQEKSMGAGGNYLAGAVVENWQAPDLRHIWAAGGIATALKTGRNPYATLTGNMVDEVEHSSQYWTNDDLAAVGHYFEGLSGGTNTGFVAVKIPDNLYTSRGGLGYVQFCSSCHRKDGAGISGIFPPLAQNPAVTSAGAATLIHIVLTGAHSAKTADAPHVFTMPALSQL